MGSAVIDAEPGSLDRFWRSVQHDAVLRVFPLLVQSYLPHQSGIGCPAVDIYIADEETDGGITALIPSVLTIDVYRFISVNVGAGVLPPAITEQMADVSREVATTARRLGFRGWLGIDFVLDRYGDLYVTEFNARRTASTQWIALLDKWKQPGQDVVHTRGVPLPASAPATLSYSDLRPTFEESWRHGVTAYPATVRGLPQGFYAIVSSGADAAEAEQHAASIQRSIDAQFDDVSVG